MNRPALDMSELWKERCVIADCLEIINQPAAAKRALEPTTSQELIGKYLAIIVKQATLLKRQDVLEQLSFAGLIYG